MENHAEFFGLGNERKRRDDAAFGMDPADQSLDAYDAPGAEIDVGLIVEHKLVPFEGMSKIGAAGHSLAGPARVPDRLSTGLHAKVVRILRSSSWLATISANVLRVRSSSAASPGRETLAKDGGIASVL